nr:hypothetical protein [Tanacetum cinerariifolium]
MVLLVLALVLTHHPVKGFVISSDSSHDSNANDADDKVTSIVRSSVPPPPVFTAVVATTTVAGATSALVHESGTGQAQPSIFKDFSFPSTAEANVAGPSQPVGVEVSTNTFFVSQDIDSEMLHQLHNMDYEQLFAEFNVGTTHQTCLDTEVKMWLDNEIRGMKRFEGKCAIQDGWLKERDAKIASLKAQLSLKEVLEGQVTALESTAVSKDAELASSNAQIAKVTQDLSNLQLSCDELSVKASSLDFEKDKLVSALETTCLDLRNEVMGVAELDGELIRMALHLDEEFYPCYLTTIAGRRWILSRGLRLVVMKCLQSSEYLAALRGVIGRAIDKGTQDGLMASIDHGNAGRVLAEVFAYDPTAQANYVAAVNALRVVDFPFLAQLASDKYLSMYDLMDLLRLEGPAAETPEAKQLQPSPDQLMLPIHRLEDQVVIGETSLSFSLDLAYAQNLVGEANTSSVPAAVATTTALSTTFVEAGFVPPIAHTEAPPSSIVFEKEELDIMPEQPTIYTIGFTHNPNHTNIQDNHNRDLILRRREERSLMNTLFLNEYECSSLALEWEGKDKRIILDHLKRVQEMLVIKIFSERKKVLRERKKCEKIHGKRYDFLQGMEQYL